MAKKKPKKSNPGPAPEHLIIGGNWEDAAKKLLEKKRPKEGWPKQPKGKK